MTETLAAPLPVLSITTRPGAAAAEVAVRDSIAALDEAARRMSLAPAGEPIRVVHDDPAVVEVCLPVEQLPNVDPPAPIAAEVLVPGTAVLPAR